MNAQEGTLALDVRNLVKTYQPRGRSLIGHRDVVRAVDGVTLAIPVGKTLALVGESGCGKSTVAKCIVGLLRPTSGSILVHGREVQSVRGRRRAKSKPDVQMVFQDPLSSLNPRSTVDATLRRPIKLHITKDPKEATDRIVTLMQLVGLDPADRLRYPHEFSGGQCQRIAIARALAVEPTVLVCDEPVSALDVSIQSQVLNLLNRLQDELGLSYLVISHDLAVVRQMADEVAVMYLGKVVERASNDMIFEDPRHPYTHALLSAIPVPEPGVHRRRVVLRGEPPSAQSIPGGCRFHPRCHLATEMCAQVSPPYVIVHAEHEAACHFAEETSLAEPTGRRIP
jgi:oligopeptide/dipeptide ABC transporter ATP-binding protein